MTNNQNVFAIKIPNKMLVQTYKHNAEMQEMIYAFQPQPNKPYPKRY